MSYIEIIDEYKRYQVGDSVVAANNGVSFSIEKGEFVIILGPSGAGKTTVLNILGGMDNCDEGQIIIDGVDIAKFNKKQLTNYRRYDVGFVFQFYNLVQNLTAKEKMLLMLMKRLSLLGLGTEKTTSHHNFLVVNSRGFR